MSSKNKKNFFQKIGLVTTEEVDNNENGSNLETTTKNEETKTVVNTESVFTSPVTNVNLSLDNNVGNFDNTHYQNLLSAIEAGDLPGIDYLEFRKAKTAIEQMPGLTEELKYKMVFNTLMATSPDVTKDKLINTIDHYKDIVDNEVKEFNEGMKQQIQESVTLKIEDAAKKDELIVQKTKQIEEIQKEISQLTSDSITLKSEAGINQAKIQTIANNFNTTVQYTKKQLDEDKVKMQQYL